MRRFSLSTLLLGINVSLLLLAVAGVAMFAANLLERLADDQALARVAQAGLSAGKSIGQTGKEVASDAQLLGERPTLRRLLETRDRESLSAFLAQFQRTGQLDGAAALIGGEAFAQSGVALAWDALLADYGRAPGSYFIHGRRGQPLILGAIASPPGISDAAVIVAVELDEAYARQLGDEIGLQVTVSEGQAALEPSALTELRRQARASLASAGARRDDLGVYVAMLPLQAPGGDTVGFIETTLPTTAVSEALREFVAALLGLTLFVAALAALVSALFGRWLARPLRALSRAAGRIGHGDLTTPVAASHGGEIGRLASTLEDMRRRLLQTTTDLRRQQAESSVIVASITEGVFSVDRERRIRYVNPQFAAMLGIPADMALGRFCGDVLDPQGEGGARPCQEQCPIVHARFRSGARATEHLKLRDGRRRIVVIASAPPSENQQVQVMRDETEVEAARRLRDAVLANISHEFKTPLSAQLASIELLLDQLLDLNTDQIAELVTRLQRGALRLTQLIDNLLESVRIEAGEIAIRRSAVAIDDIIEQALEFTRPLLKQREQTVAVELPYPLPPVAGDAPRLTQVFVNLLANAIKFSPAGSTIRIGGEAQSRILTVWVLDQGPGLPELAGRSLFERFVRAAEEPEQGGVGLGLYIVKSIVERHGGRVEAASTGSGTRMSVTLPLESVDEDPRGG